MDVAQTQPKSLEEILAPDKMLTWSNPCYWENVLPQELSISKMDYNVEDPDCKQPSRHNEEHELRTRLMQDGYALVDPPTQDRSRFDELTNTLKEGISLLNEMRIPAVFIMLCDEAWEYAQTANQVLQKSAHPCNVFNFDILAWHVDPKENTAGFSPHRDRQPIEPTTSFHDDDQAKYVTLWTALSDANPENSCLYIIPKQYDPGYTTGDGEKDPLQRALSTKEAYQHIRQAGQSVLFTHRSLHWGSRGNSKTSVEPRTAISFVCSDPSFERPYLNSNYFTEDRIPPFRIRLLLVCAQLLIYYQRFNLPKSCIRACHSYCKKHEDELDETYRGKVGIEFVKAMSEFSSRKELSNANEDADEEAILEEMLNAEQKGYGEFSDDYDETQSSCSQHVADADNFDEDEVDDDALFSKRNINSYENAEIRKKQKLT